MDSVLQGIPGSSVYLDILITGSNEQEHLKTIDTVLSCLTEAGFRLKKAKCSFLPDEVVFLGHRVDATGLHPAGPDAHKPTYVTELRSYLDILNHYARYMPGLSGMLMLLHKLLQNSVKYKWCDEQEQTFHKTKTLLTSPRLVIHFDPQKPLVLTYDSSNYGCGASSSSSLNGRWLPKAYHMLLTHAFKS